MRQYRRIERRAYASCVDSPRNCSVCGTIISLGAGNLAKQGASVDVSSSWIHCVSFCNSVLHPYVRSSPRLAGSLGELHRFFLTHERPAQSAFRFYDRIRDVASVIHFTFCRNTSGHKLCNRQIIRKYR